MSSFIAAAGQRYEQELQAGEVAGPRILLRLFACLTHTAVLHPTDVLALMERTVEVAIKQATSGAGILAATQSALKQLCGRLGTCVPAHHGFVPSIVKKVISNTRINAFLLGVHTLQHSHQINLMLNHCWPCSLWLVSVAAGADPSGITWQPWCDQLVYGVMGGLVWGGPGLKSSAAEEHEALMQKIEQYMHSRPTQVAGLLAAAFAGVGSPASLLWRLFLVSCMLCACHACCCVVPAGVC